jgi:hypothetical protein
MGLFNRFRERGADGPHQSGIEKKFLREEISRNAAEAMPLDELKQLVEDYREKLTYMEEHNESDNEIVAHHREHLKMLEEVLDSRS